MAITIQELIASDTISQVVDKINFNFDQLLLNGGGPVGPAGPQGLPGPIGGRGERGTEWYEGTNDPNVTPPTLTPLTADYYLQSNGDVWEFTGLTWTNTGINLTGPAGPTGASVGWSQFGNSPNVGVYAATAQNTLYPALITSGARQANEGVATTLIGAVGPSDVSPNPGVNLTTAFQLNTTMAGDLDSSVVSMLVHQKDSTASAIKFMGGGAIAADKFEQSALANLSSINLGTDDSIDIVIPKDVTGPIGSVSQTYGFNLYTNNKGQNFRAGRSISFTTGTLGNILTGAFDVSDFSIELNTVNSSNLPKFEVTAIGNKSASIGVGNVIPPSTTTNLGEIVLDAGNISLMSKGNVNITSLTNFWRFAGLQSTSVTPAGLVSVSSSGQIGSLSGSGGNLGSGVLSWDGTNLNSNQGVVNRVTKWTSTTDIGYGYWDMDGGSTGALYPIGGGTIGKASGGELGGAIFGSYKNIVFNEGIGIKDPANSFPTTRFAKINSRVGAALQVGLNPNSFTSIGSTSNLIQSHIFVGRTVEFPLGGVPNEVYMPKIELGGNQNYSQAIESINYRGDRTTGIYMSSALPGLNSLSHNILKIKGSTGSTLSSSLGINRGKGVWIEGGDGGTASGQGGGVLIAPGGTTDINNTGGQQMWLGYNLGYDTTGDTLLNTNVRRSASTIAIGPTQGASSSWTTPSINDAYGFVFIQQPPTEKYASNEDEYVLRIQSNQTAESPKGGVMIGTKNNQHALNIYPNLTSGAYWNHTVAGDTGMFVRTSAASGTSTGGLVLGMKDENQLGIRLTNHGGPENASQIQFWGNWNEESCDDLDEMAFRFKGKNSIMNQNFPKTAERDTDIFASGTMYPFAQSGQLAGSGNAAGYLTWQRIGRIVHVNGKVIFGGGGGQRVINLPIKGNGGTSNVWGTGTATNTSGGFISIEIRAGGTDGFSPRLSNSSWYTVNSGVISVSFSYILN